MYAIIYTLSFNFFLLRYTISLPKNICHIQKNRIYDLQINEQHYDSYDHFKFYIALIKIPALIFQRRGQNEKEMERT